MLFVPAAAFAEDLTLSCKGQNPNWSLELESERGFFEFRDRAGWLDIPQRTVAEGVDWPKAMTLVGPRDSAIILINERICQGQSHEIQVLTQRGETPILLTGCCSVAQ